MTPQPAIAAGQAGRRPAGWWILAAGIVAYGLVISFILVQRAESSSDFRDYWRTGLHLRQTGQIVHHLGVHNYLPFFVIVMTPWSLLPLRVAIVAFFWLSLVLLGAGVLLAERLLRGRLGDSPSPALLVTLGLMAPYITSWAVLGAIEAPVLALILGAWFLSTRGRPWSAGLLLGLAGLLKIIPAMLLAFFLLRGQWRVVLSAGATAVLLGAGLPLLVLGPQATLEQHRGFYQRAIGEHSPVQTIRAAHPRKAIYTNNALPIVLRRLLSPVNADPGPHGRVLHVNLAQLGPRTIGTIYGILVVGVLSTTVIRTLRATGDSQVRGAFGLWCCAMLICAPLLWTRYLLLAWWPLALLGHRTCGTGSGSSRAVNTAGCASGSGMRVGRHVVSRSDAAALLAWLAAALLLAWPAARAAGAQLLAVCAVWAALLRSAPPGLHHARESVPPLRSGP